VFYDTGRSVYFYPDGWKWQVSVSLPSSVHVDVGDYVSLDMDDDEPYRNHSDVVKRYPLPGSKRRSRKAKARTNGIEMLAPSSDPFPKEAVLQSHSETVAEFAGAVITMAMGMVGNVYQLLILRLLSGVFRGTISASISAVAIGYLSDRMGHKRVLIVNLLFIFRLYR
jgi:hypothetical protein